ncbi:MAG TPA: molybdenum cofactor biosynthesis protein MoaE [Thermoanaerobaculia bacterium]|jgi:molybdopterin synthase catalytic subunit|nr:molybdenum cofactor biosynthesis protein MoaE [Thermoanaerobaculia bacterium]
MYLTSEPIDVATFLADARPSDGAVCVFVGVVRNESDGRPTVAIEYEAYGEMAESEMARIARSLAAEWPRARLRIRHRVGRLAVGEPSVAIVAAAPHRDEAFAACRAAIERIKKSVPIWKREIHPDGSSEWVDPTRPDTIAGP